MPGKAPCPLRRRGSDKYFISPANPRASHSSVRSNSGNSAADTIPHRSNPSSLARDSTHTVSHLVRIFLILPQRKQVCEQVNRVGGERGNGQTVIDTAASESCESRCVRPSKPRRR